MGCVPNISITWEVSPQDPGCVTGYEIARSTTAGSGYTAVGTVEKSVLKYEDTTAAAGTTYYYKVRAKGGDGYSEYSNEASGKR
jgi:large repetitive protein